ncbi:ATP-dependent helicase [Singulisphaera sp. PoT]|uniref:ATP-dependent helicase n=1 Tax=Singulisphaera sp. PoT TaxID=3411797 RepID=UPI003BF521C4
MRRIPLKKSVHEQLSQQFGRDLNASQLAAASAPDGYNLILAGPGSGKTRVITYRVAYLIAKGVAPESILLVTFTRRAAREMIGRLEELIGSQASLVWAGTFHHIGNRILRRNAQTLGYGPNFTILDSEDQLDLVRLAMEEAGMFGTGKMSPKPATVQHLISFAFNVSRPIDEVVADRHPDLVAWTDELGRVAEAYARKKREANSMDYDDLLGQWARLVNDFPDQREAQGRLFRHILIDEMQDTNLVQVNLVESIANAGPGNLTAVGDDAQSIYRFRGANYDNILKFPERHPHTKIFKLETNYRSTPEIVAFTNASIAHNHGGFAKELTSARASGYRPVVVPAADAYEESEFICQQILEFHEQGIPLSRMAVLYRNHHDSILLQADLVARGIPYSVRSGQRFFEQAHIKDVLAYLRIIVNPRDEPAWRRLLLLLPGIGPAKGAAVWQHLASTSSPLDAIMTAETMKLIPAKSKGFFAGFVADVHKIRDAEPQTQPASAISAIVHGGYPATLRMKYDRPENRLADIDQLAVLAAKYESLERLIADLLLAGDVYGLDTVEDGGASPDLLVLSTIHQAKGLEWSRVFVPRLIEDGFPNRRSLDEVGGEDEERRIFYVAITRAMDELFLTYPLLVSRGGRGPSVLTTPSRFLTEVDSSLYEPAVLEAESDFDALLRAPTSDTSGNDLAS